MRGFFYGILFTVAAVFLGGLVIAKRGYVNFRADQPPTTLERRLAMAAVDASIDRHAAELKNPIPPTEENIVAGARLFRDNCAGCHGTPSNAESQFGRSFSPPVPAFFKEAPDMPDHQNFYIIQHGIRWSGMPAWNGTLSDQQTWQVVTFLAHTEKLPPAALKELSPPAAASR